MWLTVGWLGIAIVFGVLAYAFGKLSKQTEAERTAILDKAHPWAAKMPTSDWLLPAVAKAMEKILKTESSGFKLAMYAAIVSFAAALLTAFLP